ncbi:MAG: hypothetical protein J7549_19890, partial [Variovorax sp.]|nr:hypothetical protein [Variovorax sp.]
VEDDIAAYANRQRFDETSLLDLQDLSLAGGINIKRNAVRIVAPKLDDTGDRIDPRTNGQFWRPEATPKGKDNDGKVARPYRRHWCQFWRPSAKPWPQADLPPNNYIIDVRGLTCVSWDDADGTAWEGLAPFQGRGVPWRLRLQGLSFDRLDSSSQVDTIERGTWYLKLVRRSHMVISAGDETDLRIKMLRSYYQNRNETLGRDPWMTRWPFDGPPFTTHLVGDFLRGWFRWTLDTSRQRLERYPPFNPQAYETFARAYLQRGDIEAAVTISITRLSIMWRKRLRSFCRRLNVLHVFSVVTAVVLAASGLIRLSLGGTFLPQLSGLGLWFILALLAPLALYLLLWAIYLVIDWGFGFGLRGLRAICTMVALALLAAFATPLMMGDPALPADRDRGEVLQQLLYGIDKTLPVVETRIALYPPIEQTPLPTTQKLARPGTLGKAATQPPVADKFVLRQYTKGHGGATRFAILDTIWEILGWIVTSAAIFTVVGFARRDIER